MDKNRARIHFIGIAGSGLSAIARVLHERGYQVSGSDRSNSAVAQELENLGIPVYIGHRAENIIGADLIIRSSAVSENNVEVQAAYQKGIAVLKRSEFLKELTANQKVIAIAGTHGKTTTTAMSAWVFSQLGLDPSYIIGGTSLDLRTNAHAGKGEYFIIEADEYDGMFLGLNPYGAIITNVEHDHPDCYPTLESIQSAFIQFTNQINPNGVLLGCIEDHGVQTVWEKTSTQAARKTYGLVQNNGEARVDYWARIESVNNAGGFDFECFYQGVRLGSVHLLIPGEHNIRNALAVIGLTYWMGFPLDEVIKALEGFHGTQRRFEERGRVAGTVLIDDYAHHPSEIRATIRAAKVRFPGHFIWVVWQPHTFSRTVALWDQFRDAFDQADGLIVLDVFAARENEPPDFDLEKRIAHIKHAHKYYLPTISEAHDFLIKQLQGNEVVLVLSAGDANQLNDMLLSSLSAIENKQSQSDVRESKS
ncbi:MAG: UDP-N-acetylmuramate--L-alanine ligase [Anaerolineales bacterium]